MKKGILAALSMTPVLIGYVLNYSLLIPHIGIVFSYIIPCATYVFWFYLGRLYSKTNWNLFLSAFIGNAFGILSLLIYLWQFLWRNDEERNLFLVGFSQMFTASTNFLAARIAILFETDKNVYTRTLATNMQITGFVFMLLIFVAGYTFEKMQQKKRIAGNSNI